MSGALERDATVPGSRLVFVGGLHRSGTTPFTSALASHPDVSGLEGTGVLEDEGQHLQDVYPVAAVYGGPGRFALDPRSHLTEGSPLVTPQAASRLLASWRPYWHEDARLLVEKSPPNLVMGRFLQELFPGSALVVVVRHPVSVALATTKWRRVWSRHPEKAASIDVLLRNWVRAHETFLADLPRLPRVRVVRYEDLVRRPRETLAPVESLLGLDTPIPSQSLTTSRSEAYERRWTARHRTPWGRVERTRLSRRYGAVAARFGYTLDDLQPVGPMDVELPDLRLPRD